jgi:hypothetical protein
MVTAKSIVFVSLFLGLTAGPQQVEVAVDPAVAAVELRLDGAAVARRIEPPWTVEIDLGDELAPHHLEALAFDAAGEETGHAEQWINLPRQRQEVRLLLERDEAGRVTGGRLAWDSLESTTPSSLRLTLDGEPLAVDDPSAFELPRHDPSSLHVLSAEAVFLDGATARADAVFGGEYGEVTASELTAVPVLAGRRLPRRAERAGGWLAVAGEPARVVAIDAGSADLYAVPDAGADPHLDALAVEMRRRVEAMRITSPLYRTGLRPGDRLFLVHSRVEKSTGYDLFGVTAPMVERNGGTAWQLSQRRFADPSPDRVPQRLADAVAAAALEAAAGGRPRAVLLILGPDAADASRHSAARVRRFLDRLRVPLAVWYVEQLEVSLEQARRSRPQVDAAAVAAVRGRRLEAVRESWGEVTDVDGLAAWVAAAEALRQAVARQAVLWIEGAHPPGAVALGAAPDGVRLVGVGDAAPETR